MIEFILGFIFGTIIQSIGYTLYLSTREDRFKQTLSYIKNRIMDEGMYVSGKPPIYKKQK